MVVDLLGGINALFWVLGRVFCVGEPSGRFRSLRIGVDAIVGLERPVP